MAQQTDNNIDLEQGMKAAFDYFDKVSSFAKSQPVNEVKQTAVEWLDRWFRDNPEATHEQGNKALEQAKQMEKEQIVEAFYEGMKTNTFDPNRGRGIMYYNEQYGQGTPDTTSPNK